VANFGKFSKSQLEYRLEALQTRLEGQPDSDEIRRLLLDLQVHRIELELQNRELREAQRELEQARDRYADLYDFAPVGYITLERTGKIVEINLTGATILGRERARIIGMPLSAFLPPIELPRLFEHLKSVFRESGKSATQLRIQPREGNPLDVVLESIAVGSADGSGFCRTAIVDITKRKQAEDALRRAHEELEQRVLVRTAELAQVNTSLVESEARLAHAQAMAHIGSWEWNLETGEQVWSDEMFRIFGFEPQAFKPHYERTLQSIHRDDRAPIRERLQRALATGEMPEFEFRIIRPDQEQRVLHSRGEVIFSADGRALRAIGILQDITESKRTAEALQQAAVVFDNTDQGIIVADADFNIVAVNPAFTKITGYRPENVMGQNPQLLQSDRHDENFDRALWKSLGDEGHWQGEKWIRHKDGQIHPVWESITAVRNANGQRINYVSVFSDISPIKQAEERLQHLAHHDPLTGVPNRLLFDARLESALQRAKRHEHKLALMFIDLDRFKVVNDTLGHKAGDLLLQTIAQRLQGCIRAEDTVARLGGDEFTLILDEISRSEDAALVADQLLRTASLPTTVEGREIFPGASIGIGIYPDDGQNSRDLCKAADSALYLAKKRGRGQYQFYSAALTTRTLDLLALERDLRQALDRNEFILHYQPQVALDGGQIVGAEALLRWQHPELGLLAPDRFLAAAEDTGLIDPITNWVLRQACTQCVGWRATASPTMRVSVNLAARTLLHDPLLVAQVQSALADSGLRPEQLELEITEKALQTQQKSIDVLTALKGIGVTLAIDDFGTGYSCLSALKELPVDALKIDRSFVKDIPRDTSGAAISAAIITMGHNLNLRVIAEGVEEGDQLAFLRDNRCDEIQGNFLSEAVSAETLGAMIHRHRQLA